MSELAIHAHRRERPVERAIVLQLLRADHTRSWSREELRDALEQSAATVDRALAQLERAGVVVEADARLQASASLCHLDTLDIFAV